MKFMRFEYRGKTGFGVIEGDDIVRVYEGDMFNGARSDISGSHSRLRLTTHLGDTHGTEST